MSWEGETAEALRAAIRECCKPEVLAARVGEMRTAQDVRADLDISFYASLLSHVPPGDDRILNLVLSRFLGGSDNSRFGLMNAVTSVARDTPEPELRWRLEELGGGIPCGRLPEPSGRHGMWSPGEARARPSLVANR